MSVDLLITNIKGLVQVRDRTRLLRGSELSELPMISHSFLAIQNGKVVAFGPMDSLESFHASEVVDATGKFVFPGFVDSHTHLVFAASREEEFVMKIKGATYAEIAARGGGILNSAKKLHLMSDDELLERTLGRAREVMRTGTVAIEIKSGYGLNTRDELRMLRIAREVGKHTGLEVKTTFLGAHAVPQGMTRQDYIRLIIDEMIPEVASGNLADYIDVFCEEGFFSEEDTVRILEAGAKLGMKGRVHANQLHRSGGVQAGVRCGAISVDHLEQMGEEEIELLKDSSTIPTALPGAAFFLNLPFPPARKMIDAGLALAIASDFNPGSSPSGNMPFMLSLACVKMRLTPEEAINAATMNTACALELDQSHGSFFIGAAGSFFITREIPSVAFLPYAYAGSLIEQVFIKGKRIS